METGGYNTRVIQPAFRRNLVLVLCIAALAVAFAPNAVQRYSLYKKQRTYGFYSSALLDANIPPQDVIVAGTRYTVAGGSGTTAAGSSISGADARKALELAYEAAVAARSPQYGLAGTEPGRLDAQVTELARVQQAQADSLRIPSNIEAVRTSLYPIAFLRALAAAERARLVFIESGSDADAAAYRLAIGSVIEAQRHDSELFKEAYLFLGYKHAKFPLLGGTMTSDNVEQSLDAIHDAADAQAALFSKRQRCFEGETRYCDTRDLAFPLPPVVQDTRDAEAMKLAADVRAMYRQSVSELDTYGAASMLVALASSTCLASTPGPYVFSHYVAPSGSSEYRQPILLYFGDIFFSTSTTQLTTVTKGKVRTAVNLRSPTIFYECPDSGLDVARVLAVENIVVFAKKHPHIAPEERKKLLSTEIRHEEDAAEYLRSALDRMLQSEEAYSGQEERQITGLTLMFRNGSAGLDSVVHEVAALGDKNLKLIRKGYAYDDSLLFFFGSHSAFPTLFQLYNPSVVKKSVSIYDRSPEAIGSLRDTLLRYSAHPEYRSAVVQFLREFRLFERE